MNTLQSYSVLESTLRMHGAEKYLPIFKQFGIDTKTLALLNEEDLISIGVDDKDIQNKLLQQVKNLPKTKEPQVQIDEDYAMIVLKDVESHLKLIQACVSICLAREDVNISDIKLTKSVQILQNSVNLFNIELNNFKKQILPNEKRHSKKLKYILPIILTTTLTVFAFKKYFFP